MKLDYFIFTQSNKSLLSIILEQTSQIKWTRIGKKQKYFLKLLKDDRISGKMCSAWQSKFQNLKTKNNYVSILSPHVIEAKPLLKVQKTFSLKKKDLKVFRFFLRIIFFLSRKNRELINSFCSFSHSTFNLNGGHRNLNAISIKLN